MPFIWGCVPQLIRGFNPEVVGSIPTFFVLDTRKEKRSQIVGEPSVTSLF